MLDQRGPGCNGCLSMDQGTKGPELGLPVQWARFRIPIRGGGVKDNA